MKLPKISPRRRPGFLLCCVLLAILFAGCDTFESDVTGPDVQVSGEELYVLAGGETVIDLNALVSANVAGRLTVTELPTQGTLQNIAEGLLRYVPKGVVRTRDSFELTVFNANNGILKKDTIYINIETDSIRLPCNIYPIADYITGLTDSSTVSVNVLKNDLLCGKVVVTEVYASHLIPRHGTAEMDGTTMVYTPGASFMGIDTVIYKVINTQNPSSFGYGFVYINFDSLTPPAMPELPCILQAVQDSVDITALSTSLIYLDVLKNDQLCDSLKTFTITRLPRHGTAIIDTSTKRIRYNRVVLESDSLQYEICNGKNCSRATAHIKQG